MRLFRKSQEAIPRGWWNRLRPRRWGNLQFENAPRMHASMLSTSVWWIAMLQCWGSLGEGLTYSHRIPSSHYPFQRKIASWLGAHYSNAGHLFSSAFGPSLWGILSTQLTTRMTCNPGHIPITPFFGCNISKAKRQEVLCGMPATISQRRLRARRHNI